MNKGRRQELKLLKFRKRLKKWGLREGAKIKLHAFRSHGSPCSCFLCRDVKYREKRSASKLDALNNIEELNLAAGLR